MPRILISIGHALLLTAAVSSQQTIIVDAAGGGQFTDIQPAIDAASPGDTVIVRAGSYPSFQLTKGLRVLGDPGVTIFGTRFQVIIIRGVPASATAVVRGFAPALPFLGFQVSIHDCVGQVHVENILAGGIYGGAAVVNCGNVTLAGLRVATAGTRIDQSTVSLTRCQFSGTPTQVSLDINRSRVWLAESECRGSDESLPFFQSPGNAIRVANSSLYIAGDSATVVATGTATSTIPVSAIVSTASTVTVDSNVTLTGHAGGPPMSGTGTLVIGQIPSLRATQTVPTQLDTRLFAPGAQRGATLLSLIPPQPTPLVSIGDLWVEQNNLVLDFGPVPASGVRTAAFLLPSLPPGLAVMTQAIVIYPTTVQLSAPAPLTLGI